MFPASQEKGRNVDGYVQCDTIWRLRSRYGIIFDTSPEAVLDPIIFKNERGVKIPLWVLLPFKISWFVYCVEWEGSFTRTYPLIWMC